MRKIRCKADGPQPTLRLLLLALSTQLAACDTIGGWLAFLSPEGNGVSSHGSTLLVIVDPPDNLVILLDGTRIGALSPHRETDVKAGRHSLEVRAMGYHSFTTEVTLRGEDEVRVPVKLRRRSTSQPRPRPPVPVEAPPLPPTAPETLAPELPPQTGPELSIRTIPAADVTVNGIARSARFRLNRVRGRIQIGTIVVGYRVSGANLLHLTLPDHGSWVKDFTQRKPGTSFRLDKGTTRLEVKMDGVTQAILLRRF